MAQPLHEVKSATTETAAPLPHGWQKNFLPYRREQMVKQEAKGLFIPYPLLGVMITLCVLLVSGIIAIQVQVSNLNTTLLLRDADSRSKIEQLTEKTEQLQVYIYDSREKLVKLQAEVDNQQNGKRRQ